MLKECPESIESWNNWLSSERESDPSFILCLDGIHLSHYRLDNIDLSGAYLAGTKFREAQLRHGNFIGSDLSGCDFSEAKLLSSRLSNVLGVKADFRGADLSMSTILNSNFTESDFILSKLDNSNVFATNFTEATLAGASCVNTRFDSICLHKAKMARVKLGGSQFFEASLLKAKLYRANFEGAEIRNSELLFCDSDEANLKSVGIYASKLHGTNFSFSLVDENTIIRLCQYDNRTLFTGVALTTARIDPDLRIAFDTNTRRAEWEDWFYARLKPIRDRFLLTKDTWYHRYIIPEEKFSKDSNICDYLKATTFGKLLDAHRTGIIAYRLRWLLSALWVCTANRLIKAFWEITDYGSSTKKLIFIFLGICALFAMLYTSDWFALCGPSASSLYDPWTLKRFLQMLQFSTASMVTLGFGGINVDPTGQPFIVAIISYVAVVANLMVGYVMLAALVTRLGILFQSPGPGR